MPFVEALTQFRQRAGKGNFVNIHVSYVPLIHGEEKSKPTQHSVRGALQAGLIPDIIACRCERPISSDTIAKIARSCHLTIEQVITVRDMKTVYQVPLLLEQQGLVDRFTEAFGLNNVNIPGPLVNKGKELWKLWNKTVLPKDELECVDIAIVGKYVETHDAYLSVVKALEHSAMRCNKNLHIIWVDSEHLEDSTQAKEPAKHDAAWKIVHSVRGVVIPGGFGERGVEGMIKAASWTRTNRVPMLGICLGMQVAVIEAARNLCGDDKSTTSEEFGGTAESSAIIFMPEGSRTEKGGTMRLGARPTLFQPGSDKSKLRALYAYAPTALERHRHRYEVNPTFVPRLEKAGLAFIGKDDTGKRMEIVELADHPWYVGVQFHPEYKSKVLDPSRPYLGFFAASAGCLEQTTAEIVQEAKGVPNGVTHTF
ncbi:CTP synthase [Lachnellula suecica]|uniref:CTP synthase n=1 Tax=Lachnellula suecica TaxID=602035 RepID=A0A8T9BRW7_9HELO|nr:CTP synthase [Lachnellula suecica]